MSSDNMLACIAGSQDYLGSLEKEEQELTANMIPLIYRIGRIVLYRNSSSEANAIRTPEAQCHPEIKIRRYCHFFLLRNPHATFDGQI